MEIATTHGYNIFWSDTLIWTEKIMGRKVKTTIFPSTSAKTVRHDNSTSLLEPSEIIYSETYQTMLASERVLARDWDQPDEDEAWRDL